MRKQVRVQRARGTSAERETDNVADRVGRLDSAAAAPARPLAGVDVASPTDSRGEPLDTGTRDLMQAQLGHDFSRVRVHADGRAAASAEALNARAYTLGHDVVFGPGEYAPATSAGRHLLAHELAHVVQQSTGAAPPMIQRKVKTLGGEFDTDSYTVVKAGGKDAGVDIDLKFTPQEPVDATKIGMLQTANTINEGAVVALNDTVKGRSIPKDEKGMEAGAHIDQLQQYRNPLYATGPTAAGDTLKSTATKAQWGQHGWHYRDGGGALQKQEAHLKDTPTYEPRGNNASQTFESTALAVDGNQAGTYYGSVRWGWKTDDKGNFSQIPLSLISPGVPTPTFMRAAELWNKGKSSTGEETFDLPTSKAESGTVAPENRTTGDLIIRLEDVKKEVATLPAGSDKTNKEFEQKALEAELARRADKPTTTLAAEAAKAVKLPTKDLVSRLETVTKELFEAAVKAVGAAVAAAVGGAAAAPDPTRTDKELERHALEEELKTRKAKVDVKVISTEDWIGSDEVYVRVTGAGGKKYKTPVHSLNDGQSFSFLVPLDQLTPLTGPLKVEVFDEDWPDADDLIVTIDWASPFGQQKNTGSGDGANYDVKVEFER